MTTATTATRYYDHATNIGGANPAKGTAVARAARECRADGTAYRVEFTNRSGVRCWWSGDRHTALALAKDFTGPGCPPHVVEQAAVTFTHPSGRVDEHDQIKAARF